MRRFLLWLCSKGMHRGDVTILWAGMTIVECRTCECPVFYKWGKGKEPGEAAAKHYRRRNGRVCPLCLTVDGTRHCRHSSV